MKNKPTFLRYLFNKIFTLIKELLLFVLISAFLGLFFGIAIFFPAIGAVMVVSLYVIYQYMEYKTKHE